MTTIIVLGIIGLVMLVAGGEFLVTGASGLARKLRMSSLLIGLTIVAFGTSAPELFISVRSAFMDSPDLVMGNIIGSNIANLALVLNRQGVANEFSLNFHGLGKNLNYLRSRNTVAQDVELLLKVLVYNMTIIGKYS